MSSKQRFRLGQEAHYPGESGAAMERIEKPVEASAHLHGLGQFRTKAAMASAVSSCCMSRVRVGVPSPFCMP